MKYSFILLLLFSLNVLATDGVKHAKENGVKFILDDSESIYNEIIRSAVKEHWSFSDFAFISRSEYDSFKQDQSDVVFGLFDVSMQFQSLYGSSEHVVKIFCSFNEHSHVTSKNHRIDGNSTITHDYVPEIKNDDNRLKVLMISLIKEHNSHFQKLYDNQKIYKPTTSYGHLKQLSPEIKNYPIYILKKDMALDQNDLDKLANPNVKIVEQEEIDQAILNSEKVLIYRHEEYLLTESIKKLINAETGETYVYILNRNMDYYNAGVLKNIISKLK